MRRLIVQAPEGERELLFVGRLTVGRAPECDISVADTKISRRHAEFDATGPVPRVTDLGSRNGILVNGRKVAGADLSNGDVVTMGELRIRFEEALTAPPPPPPPPEPEPPAPSELLDQKDLREPAAEVLDLGLGVPAGGGIFDVPAVELPPLEDDRTSVVRRPAVPPPSPPVARSAEEPFVAASPLDEDEHTLVIRRPTRLGAPSAAPPASPVESARAFTPPPQVTPASEPFARIPTSMGEDAGVLDASAPAPVRTSPPRVPPAAGISATTPVVATAQPVSPTASAAPARETLRHTRPGVPWSGVVAIACVVLAILGVGMGATSVVLGLLGALVLGWLTSWLIGLHTAATLHQFTRQVEQAVSGGDARTIDGRLLPGLDRLAGIVSDLVEQRRAGEQAASTRRAGDAESTSGSPWIEVTPALMVVSASSAAPGSGVRNWTSASGRNLLDVLEPGALCNAIVQGLSSLAPAPGAVITEPVPGHAPVTLRREPSGHVRVDLAAR